GRRRSHGFGRLGGPSDAHARTAGRSHAGDHRRSSSDGRLSANDRALPRAHRPLSIFDGGAAAGKEGLNAMLTELDDSVWHQLPTTFDHVGTSDPRFFDRLWFAASDCKGGSPLQFTMGV